ncbi:MAG: DUF362 domain-containing protein [Clostridia bacterium]|nr:DUF362 domain-containing protein [Clostridia bacterium]NCC43365.1 DUF362 domain-containing protein [Clostridia bacterium]
MKSKVILVPCDSYEEEQVYEKIKTGISLLGGWESLIRKEEKILLKPNLVRKAEVSRAVITHPAVVGAVARLLRENGYEHLGCGDSCGVGDARKVMEGTGMDTLLDQYDVTVEDFGKASMVDDFYLARPVQEADALINLCKMKTHALERVTGGVKNLYGCISGFHKAQGHTRYPNADSFARMLIELNQKIRPRLCIMDAVVAMEGNGPTSGDPIPMNLIMIGTDPVAVDSVFCHLVHLKPELVPTNIHGERMGLGQWKEEMIQILTPDGEISMQEAVKRYGDPDYNVDRRKQRKNIWSKFRYIMKPFGKRPYIVDADCKKCGICVEACPVEGKAITFKNGRKEPPKYDYKKCIRCFCCQEMCPHKAIQVR